MVDRLERLPERRTVLIERPSLSFRDGAERANLEAVLRSAERAGAVELRPDRDAPHLIAEVRLRDVQALYRFLDRTPRSTVAEHAAASLSKAATTPEGAALATYVTEGWLNGRRPLSLGPANVAAAVELIRAADAAFTPSRKPLRARSIEFLGDSKSLERALPRLFQFLRATGRVAPEASDIELRATLGLERYQHPVLVAGNLGLPGSSIENWTYAGIPPELAGLVVVRGPVRSLLTIENLESFNRHVREAKLPGDVVIYTAGFAAPAVIELILAVAASGIRQLWHWGDIDVGGLRILHHLAERTGLHVRPHLMSVALARAGGRPVERTGASLVPPNNAATAELVAMLSSDEAFYLEQEHVDPIPIEI